LAWRELLLPYTASAALDALCSSSAAVGT